MERRGIETEVGKRLDAEALAAAQQRLEKAARLGKLERESLEVQRSIFDLSGDLDGAKRERDFLLLRQKQLAEKAPSLEQIRAQARENWLEMRAEQHAKEKTPEASREASAEQEKSTRLTLDAQRKEAVQHWLKYRQETLHPVCR